MADNVIGTAQIDVVVDASQAKKGLTDVQSSVDKLKGPFRDVVGLTEQLAGGLGKTGQQATKLGAEMLGAFGAGGPVALGIAAVGASIALWVKYFQDAEKAHQTLINAVEANRKHISNAITDTQSYIDKLKLSLLTADELQKKELQFNKDRARYTAEKTGATLGEELAALAKGTPLGLRKDDGTEAWLYEREKATNKANERIIRLREELKVALSQNDEIIRTEALINAKKAAEEQAKLQKELDENKIKNSKELSSRLAEEERRRLAESAAMLRKELNDLERELNVKRKDLDYRAPGSINQQGGREQAQDLDKTMSQAGDTLQQLREFGAASKDVLLDVADTMKFAFADAVGSATDALITQGKLTGPIMKGITADILKSIAIQSSVKGAFETAEAIASLVGGNLPAAAGHGIAASKYFAVAALAGSAASALGAGGNGTSTAGSLLNGPMQAKKDAEEAAKKKKEELEKQRNQESRAARAASRRASETSGTVVNINFVGSAFVTKAQVGKEVQEALREYSKLKN